MSSLAYETTPFEMMSQCAASDGFIPRSWLNDTVVSTSSGIGGSGTVLSDTTVGVASNSDACIYFLNRWPGDGGDRSELANADQDLYVFIHPPIT